MRTRVATAMCMRSPAALHLASITTTSAIPIAWSPSNRYLAVSLQTFPGPSQLEVIDTQTGGVISTHYATDFGSSPALGSTARTFFGWLDDTTFLGAISKLVSGPQSIEAPGTSTLVRVDLTTGKETVIGTIPGWVVFGLGIGPAVRVVANGRYLFYAAYAGSTAYLHRFDLTTGTDSTLVSLGLYTYGGCQGSNVCGWTAPWDVSFDGSHILYHHPGASSAPSDTNNPKDTPVLYANPDGSDATRPFGTQLAASLVEPVFSPNGSLAVTTGSTYSSTDPFSGTQQMEVVALGAPYTVVTGSLVSWRGDDLALVTSVPRQVQGSTASLLKRRRLSKRTPTSTCGGTSACAAGVRSAGALALPSGVWKGQRVPLPSGSLHFRLAPGSADQAGAPGSLNVHGPCREQTLVVVS